MSNLHALILVLNDSNDPVDTAGLQPTDCAASDTAAIILARIG